MYLSQTVNMFNATIALCVIHILEYWPQLFFNYIHNFHPLRFCMKEVGQLDISTLGPNHSTQSPSKVE